MKKILLTLMTVLALASVFCISAFAADPVMHVLYGSMPKDFDNFEDGELPDSLTSIIAIDPKTGHFVCKNYTDITIGTIYDVFDAMEEHMSRMEAWVGEE